MSTLEAKEMEAWAFTTLQMAMGPNVISEIVSEKTAARFRCKISIEDGRMRIEDGRMRISRGNIIVMKGEQAENNFFHLIGETVSSEAYVVDSSKNLDAAHLWHLILGHTSEKNLEILSK